MQPLLGTGNEHYYPCPLYDFSAIFKIPSEVSFLVAFLSKESDKEKNLQNLKNILPRQWILFLNKMIDHLFDQRISVEISIRIKIIGTLLKENFIRMVI